MLQAIFFDLDGTLVDTSNDLIQAIKYALDIEDIEELSTKKLRQQITKGFRGLASELVDVDTINYATMHDKFVAHYEQNISRHSRFFPSLDKLLMYLHEHRFPHGIVTNKSTYLAEKLMKQLLPSWEGVLIGGDLYGTAKPAPDLLLHALDQAQQKYQSTTNIQAKGIYYVGDYPTDIKAAQKANWKSVIAAYGFLPDQPTIQEWQADLIIDSPQALSEWVMQNI